MHFQLHRITSQAKNIVNRCGWLSYYLCLDVHAPKANGSQFVYLCICMSDLKILEILDSKFLKVAKTEY